jgi:DNA mismatch endonuclease (patch repair protein)
MVIISTSTERSLLMSKIGAKDTKPELAVRKTLHSFGIRYRLHYKTLPGTPDLVLPKYKTVIFVNGCFWHSHNCPKGTSRPKTNKEFWENKISNNVKRDTMTKKVLTGLGWKVVTIWECQTKDLSSLQKTLLNLLPKKDSILR